MLHASLSCSRLFCLILLDFYYHGMIGMYSLPVSFPARVDRVDLSHHWETNA
jgi:hypothetical protein